ncbi:sulfotransferase domain-containing protein (plasmid) [Microbulbifer sp. MKSA007]|nr:sulfotransferase domain-containing protein [Microbulbifer sp. MKSA007]
MKKVMIHIGAHKTGTTALQKQLYAKHPDLFDDRTSFKTSAFLQMFENRMIKPKADELADLFQEALFKPDTDVYRISHERLMGKAFVHKQFYPNVKRYSQLVKELEVRGVEVKTLVTVRNRTDFLVSFFLHCLSWHGTPKTFHEFANKVVTPSFAWQSVAQQLERLSVTYLPHEAMENQPNEYVACINQFYESELLQPNDLSSRANSGLNELGLSIIPQLSKIEDQGLRSVLLKSALDYCKQGERAKVLSKDIDAIYRKHFVEGDIAFAKINFPAPFRKIYSQTKHAAEQFWFNFAKADA